MKKIFLTSLLFAFVAIAGWVAMRADAQSSSGLGVSITIQSNDPPPDNNGGGGGGGGGGGQTSGGSAVFVMKGKAYPSASLTVLHNGVVARTLIAEPTGVFEVTLSGLSSGIQTFGVYAQDTEGRRSVTIGFTLNVPANTTTTLEGLVLPSTIDISSVTVNQGQALTIAGQSFPQSDVNLFVRSTEVVKRASSSPAGQWKYVLDTTPFELGDHTVRSKVQTVNGEQSEFSEVKSFRIIPPGARGTPGSCTADLNGDNRADIIDLSILLYNWGVPKNSAADFNKDSRVDVVDFSILLYYWGTCI